MTTGARYALYLAPPPDGDLWRRACAWLGRDAARDVDVPFAGPAGVGPARAAAITTDARHYGFHATIKAPFRLADGMTPEALCDAAGAFARSRAAFPLALRVSALGSFLALAEARPDAAIATLHAEALAAFEPFRAPLGEADLARRLAANLTEQQKRHLAEWGYPYVLDDFRLHFTLTGRLPAEERAGLMSLLTDHFAADLAVPMPVDAICVFEQPSAEAPFRIVYRAPFAATA
jgi:putative phosphonate metabolism protein